MQKLLSPRPTTHIQSDVVKERKSRRLPDSKMTESHGAKSSIEDMMRKRMKRSPRIWGEGAPAFFGMMLLQLVVAVMSAPPDLLTAVHDSNDDACLARACGARGTSALGRGGLGSNGAFDCETTVKFAALLESRCCKQLLLHAGSVACSWN